MITEAKYVKDPGMENNCGRIVMDGVEKFIPFDDNNKYYKELLEWVAEGNTIEEAT